MRKVSVNIRNAKPKPWGSKEVPWRQAIAKTINPQEKIRGLSKSTKYNISIVFYLIKVKGVDLDNLAKPVLDTLFHCKRPQVKMGGITGVLFDKEVDDDHVFRLKLEKRQVKTAQDEGCDILVSW